MVQAPIITKPIIKKAPNRSIEPIISLVPQHGQTTRFGRLLKAILDYMLVIPGLILISPLLLFLAVLVKLDSPGPIIHRRRVLGLNGREFDAFKFRTMYVNGNEILAQYPKLQLELAHSYKLKCDPRVTRVGQFLRKFSLDELPQLFNILLQDMSLVGPRIIAPAEIVKYGSWGSTRVTVMPGLTGMWQVSGRSDTDYAERIRLDKQYVDNYTIGLDIKIILRTIPAVLKGDGAY